MSDLSGTIRAVANGLPRSRRDEARRFRSWSSSRAIQTWCRRIGFQSPPSSGSRQRTINAESLTRPRSLYCKSGASTDFRREKRFK
jgi:hypothetical protein